MELAHAIEQQDEPLTIAAGQGGACREATP